MKPRLSAIIFSFLFSVLILPKAQAQNFGTIASAVSISDCNQSDFFNTSGSGADLIGPSGNVFTGANLGVHTQNSSTLILRGAEIRTFKTVGAANVCAAKMYYRIYAVSATPGAFGTIDLPLLDNCNTASSQYPTGGSCSAGNQKWNRVIADGASSPSPVNLTAFAPGNYTLEIYFEITGSNTTTTGCSETVTLNNAGANYKASFSIQSPELLSNNPTSCNGNEGSITIEGLASGQTYEVSYFDDGTFVGPANLVSNGSGQITLTGLNAGVYSNFSLLINGCTTDLFVGQVLSNPVVTPKFTKVNPFCAGTTPPTLPTVSNNGISGSWSPSAIDNQTSGTYTFTPDPGQCAITSYMNVTVKPNVTPTFSFGTSLSICEGATAPTLPATSTNSITGSWSPAAVDNLASGTYTFTPTSGQCATTTTLTVTVNPNVTPTFSFGTSLTVCQGATVPTLSTTSTNSITGTWSPAAVDNQASGTYTFTPTSGQCATTTSLTVTVNPTVIPTFGFGNSLTICGGASVPTLPATSDNSVTGSWNPAVVDNLASGTYTFTPTSGQCAVSFVFTVTVNPNVTPTFSFGTALSICEGATVPTLPATSTNSITGSWSPAAIDNLASGTYTFTPTSGQCATTTTLTVTVNPNVTPAFSFGTSLTVCQGATVPTLSTTSTNSITGTWSPAAVDNQASGTYTFTPTSGQCATTTTLTVTVNPTVIPTFSFGNSLTICEGGSVPTLPTTSDNSLTGSWNPAVVDNLASGTYTFTPTSGQCAVSFVFTVTVNPNITPTFSFGTSPSICEGATVPTLPATSTNSINGSWSPGAIDNQASGTYTFTPTSGQCATTTTLTVTVNPNITPAFSFGTSLTVCQGTTVPTLSTTSTNSITGTWSPAAVDNQASGTYTFTPTSGQCATTTTLTVTVNPTVIPTFSFGNSLTICEGASVPTLPATSDNSVTGSWNPAVVDNLASGTYTFTPTSGQCAVSFVFTVTVNPNITPTFSFGTALSICEGATVPTLPATSTNSINGSWSPGAIDNQASGTYTFTPTSGQCATTTTLTVTVNPNVTPAFSFGTSLTVCQGATVPTLSTTSTNSITGTWSPAAVDNQASGTYTFTPTSGQCATTTTLTVTVNPTVIPIFSFGNSLIICGGGSVPTLPATSDNSLTGSWNPAVVDNQASGTYTFTPTSGQCAVSFVFTVTVNPNITPTFSFGTALSICEGGSVPTLPATSTNSITGSWSPAAIDNQASGTYTFTPTSGQCATTTTLTVTANPNITPAFSFGTDLTACSGSPVPPLPAVSLNGISGTWNPAGIDDQASDIYTFTPAADQCATTTTFNVTITPSITPTFDFGTELSICKGGDVPDLTTTSLENIDGAWDPAVIDKEASGVYTFTPNATPEQCITPVTFTVTVNEIVAPTFSFGTTLTACAGATVPVLPATSMNGIAGTWSPAVISNQVSGTYTFTSTAGQCALPTAVLTVTIKPVGTVNAINDITVTDGTTIPSTTFTGNPGVSFNWTNSNSSIGLPASGSGNISSFVASNSGDAPVSSMITVTPVLNGCSGDPRSYVIQVIPLTKDLFVPNVFTPNGDGKNDKLFVYANKIEKLDMRIFNQWGQQIETINSLSKGWDGTYHGKPQPVGVYVYTLRAVMSDGRNIELKGNITLLR